MVSTSACCSPWSTRGARTTSRTRTGSHGQALALPSFFFSSLSVSRPVWRILNNGVFFLNHRLALALALRLGHRGNARAVSVAPFSEHSETEKTQKGRRQLYFGKVKSELRKVRPHNWAHKVVNFSTSCEQVTFHVVGDGAPEDFGDPPCD